MKVDMADNKWRNKLDSVVEQNLKELVKETKEFDYAIKSSSNKSKAQMWVAMALINSKLNRILLEGQKTPPKLSEADREEILKTLEGY